MATSAAAPEALAVTCDDVAPGRVDGARSLADVALGHAATVRDVTGSGAFRRRLLEMGLVPGVVVRVVSVAPLGDPLQIEVRGGQWSIRRDEAMQIRVSS